MNTKRLWQSTAIFMSFFLCWLLALAFFSWQSLASLQQQEWLSAKRHSQVAAFLIWPLDATLGKVSTDVHLWAVSVRLIPNLVETQQLFAQYLPALTATDPGAREIAGQVEQNLTALQPQTVEWFDTYQDSIFLRPLISRNISSTQLKLLLENPTQLKQFATHFFELAEYLLTGNHTYLILLQNTDELRATGGFIGSYVRVQLEDGALTQLNVQDIYTPDGQNTTFTEAPPGLKEYLSAGNGLRLPDANWNPEFTSSAQDLIKFFALGKENDVAGIVAVNLTVAEKLLQFTGPIYLPDYNQTVTPENLSSLARSDRSTFFAGSQQKRSFLQALFTQLKIRLTTLNPDQIPSLIQLLRLAVQQKDIQAYSTTPTAQTFFDFAGLTQTFPPSSTTPFFYLVESNVGINKVNRLVQREVTLTLQAEISTVRVDFTNKNPQTSVKAERGEYINYQRLFVPENYQVKSILLGNQPVEKWDNIIMTNSNGILVRQIGFLVPVAAESSATVTITLAHPQRTTNTITLYKQSGLHPTLYHLQTPTTSQDLILDQDKTIEFGKIE